MAGDVELYSLMDNGVWSTITAVSDPNGSRVEGSHRVVLYVYAQLGVFVHLIKAASIVLERNSVSASSSSHEQRLAFNSPSREVCTCVYLQCMYVCTVMFSSSIKCIRTSRHALLRKAAPSITITVTTFDHCAPSDALANLLFDPITGSTAPRQKQRQSRGA
jgi:hypothetical protein